MLCAPRCWRGLQSTEIGFAVRIGRRRFDLDHDRLRLQLLCLQLRDDLLALLAASLAVRAGLHRLGQRVPSPP